MKIMCNTIYEIKGCSNSHPETCECERGCNHPQFVPPQAQNRDSCALRDHEGEHTIASVMFSVHTLAVTTTNTSCELHVNEVSPQPFDGCGWCLTYPCRC